MNVFVRFIRSCGIMISCKCLVHLCLFASIMMLCACMDLASNESKNKKAVLQHFAYRKGQVYTMRGLGGIFSRGMNRLEDTLEDHYHIRTSSTIWYKANELSDFIHKNYESKALTGPIVLIGHSLGANEQIKVAKNLAKWDIPVDLLITIDAVAPMVVPSNVKEAFNIYKPGVVPMFSGLRLRSADPALQSRIDNYNAATELTQAYVNHFTIDKHALVQKLMLEKVLSIIKK